MPTLYLTNWSSHRTPGRFGSGPRLTIMARPRRWEHGDGSVPILQPVSDQVVAAKAGALSVDDYRRVYLHTLAEMPRDRLGPGGLTYLDNAMSLLTVSDGATLCCACKASEAAASRCHRAWAALMLALAGWRVVLDGQEVSTVPTAFTIGASRGYDPEVARRVPLKLGARPDGYPGGCVWRTREAAESFLRDCPGYVPAPKVYGLLLPRGWDEDVSAERGPDGYHHLRVDAPLVALGPKPREVVVSGDGTVNYYNPDTLPALRAVHAALRRGR